MKTLRTGMLFLAVSLLLACGQQLVEFANPSDGGDTTAPVVTFTNPVSDATGVPVNATIRAMFNEGMDPASLNGQTFTLKRGTIAISGVVSYAGVTATFSPSNNLAGDTTFTATITTGAMDVAGNAMAASYVWTFDTAASPDTTAPRLNSTNPVDLAVGVPTNKKLTATFNEAMDPLTITATHFTLMQGTTAVTGTVAFDAPNNIATFTPSSPLALNTVYTALVSTGATDVAGNALASSVVPNPWSFTTVEAAAPFISVDLGLATPVAIAATAGVTNTITAPITHINGDVVLDPNQTCNAVTVDNAGGFGLCDGMAPTISGTVITNTYPDTTTAAAVKADLNAAFLAITPLDGPPAVGVSNGVNAHPTSLGGP